MENEQQSQSPTPAQVPAIVKGKPYKMTFLQAIQEVIAGHKITKLEWANTEDFCELKDGILQIHKSIGGTWHSWIISDGDILGEDWITLN